MSHAGGRTLPPAPACTPPGPRQSSLSHSSAKHACTVCRLSRIYLPGLHYVWACCLLTSIQDRWRRRPRPLSLSLYLAVTRAGQSHDDGRPSERAASAAQLWRRRRGRARMRALERRARIGATAQPARARRGPLALDRTSEELLVEHLAHEVVEGLGVAEGGPDHREQSQVRYCSARRRAQDERPRARALRLSISAPRWTDGQPRVRAPPPRRAATPLDPSFPPTRALFASAQGSSTPGEGGEPRTELYSLY